MNYKKETEALQKQWRDSIKEKDTELFGLRQKAENAANQYNPRIAAINSERARLFDEIRELYNFLKSFGDIGKPITPFDFAVEDFMWPKVGSFDPPQHNSPYMQQDNSDNSGGILGKVVSTGSTVAVISTAMFFPIATPAALLGKGLINEVSGHGFFTKKADKEKYQNVVWECEKDLCARAKRNDDAATEVNFFEAARDIAEIYLHTIMGIKSLIDDTILPELDGITAFLYADAVKNCIIEGEDPRRAEPGSITEYEGTAYDAHYVFVQNAFDYYIIITKFFSDRIMGSIFADHLVTVDELDELHNRVNEIESRQKLLQSSTVFGG